MCPPNVVLTDLDRCSPFHANTVLAVSSESANYSGVMVSTELVDLIEVRDVRISSYTELLVPR